MWTVETNSDFSVAQFRDDSRPQRTTGTLPHDGDWMFGYGDEGLDISAAGFDGKDRELVLGRGTYQIFEAYWPYQPDERPIANAINAAKKHVASRTLTTLDWNNSTLIHGDVVAAINAIKAQLRQPLEGE